MKVWLVLASIFAILTLVGICMGKIRHEAIDTDDTVSGLITSIGGIGTIIFGMLTMICILG